MNYLAVTLLLVAKSLFRFLLVQVHKGASAKQSLTWNGVSIPKLIIMWVNRAIHLKAINGGAAVLYCIEHFVRTALEEAGAFISQVLLFIKNHGVSMYEKFCHLVEPFNFFLRFADFPASLLSRIFNRLRLFPLVKPIPLRFIGVEPFGSSFFNNFAIQYLLDTKVNQLQLFKRRIEFNLCTQFDGDFFCKLSLIKRVGNQFSCPYAMRGKA